MLDKLKTWAIILLTLSNLFGILGAYIKGKEAGENETRQYYELAEQANTAYFQAKIFQLNESAELAKSNNQLRFQGLQNEFIQKSNDLKLCQYNADQLRHIKTAANLQASTTAKLGAAARAGITTDSESRELFTCQDAGVTMIVWAEQYFSCKTKLDYLQGMWSQ